MSATEAFAEDSSPEVVEDPFAGDTSPELSPRLTSKKRIIHKTKTRKRRTVDDIPTITEEEYGGKVAKSVVTVSVPMNDVKKAKYLFSPRFVFFMMLSIVVYLSIWLVQQYNSDVFFHNWIDTNQSSIGIYSGVYFVVVMIAYGVLFTKKKRKSTPAPIVAAPKRIKKVISKEPEEALLPQEELITEEASPAPIPEEETPSEEEQVEVVPYKE